MTEYELDILLFGSTEPVKYTLVSTSGNRYNEDDFIEGVAAKIERKHLGSTSESIRS